MTEEPNGWRGATSARVDILERGETELRSRLTKLSEAITLLHADAAVMRVRQNDQITRLTEIKAALRENREEDLVDLHKALDRSRESTRSMLIYLLAPLLVLVIGGLILYALTNHPVTVGVHH